MTFKILQDIERISLKKLKEQEHSLLNRLKNFFTFDTLFIGVAIHLSKLERIMK